MKRYEALAADVEESIRRGELRPGDRLAPPEVAAVSLFEHDRPGGGRDDQRRARLARVDARSAPATR